MVVLGREANCSRLLVGRVQRHRAGSHSLQLICFRRLMVRYGSLALELACLEVVHHELVIVSRSDHLFLIRDNFKTPDFTFKMRLHYASFLRILSC
jgi:hypothetical protein